ncbi:MAG: SDR family oxidoreductase [Nitrospirae bacterium]|nr:SDR family oxidoreductase [Nitrospirota bacterium]
MVNYLAELFRLQGKVAALTGGGGYLVGEMVAAFARVGVKVALMDIDLESAEKVAEKINADGGEAVALRVDVTQKSELEVALVEIMKRYRSADILVNGAGMNAPTSFLEITLEEWYRILDVQLTGTMLACQVFGAHMVKQGKGSIVNISSASASPPLSKAFAYSVAKAGVKNLTQNLAREWAMSGVRVNALRPGFFPTDWSKKNFLTPDRVQAILNHTPMGRFGDPRELVGAVLWLCSDAASFVTGAEIAVDGGFSGMTI